MKRVFIRDDDVNFFTNPADLDAVYGPVLASNIPVTFAAIPEVDARARTLPDATGRTFPEAFLPDAEYAPHDFYAMDANEALTRWFKEKPLTELAVHGWSHTTTDGLTEVESAKPDRLNEMLPKGKAMFESINGRSPDVFVAPHDRYTNDAVRHISNHFRVFSTGWFDRRRLPAMAIPAWLKARTIRSNKFRYRELTVISHPGCLFSPAVNAADCERRLDDALKAFDDVVLVLHHWELSRDGTQNHELIDRFHGAIEKLRSRYDVRFTALSLLSP